MLTSSRLLILAALMAPALAVPAAAQPGAGRGVVAAPRPPPPPMEVAIGDRGTGRAARALPTGPPTFQGILTDSDSRRDGGAPYDAYPVDVRDGDEVTVTMTADDFDTYLVVQSAGGQEWTNDDFGSTRVSQVTFRATESGRYTVLATAYGSSGRGAYEVRVSAVRAVIVSTVAGRLDYQDQQQIKGEYFDTVMVRPPSSGTFYVELVPLGFSGYLRVTSPGGVITRSEAREYSDEQVARLGPFQAERGEWRVDVTSSGGRSLVGAYDVRVITMDAGR